MDMSTEEEHDFHVYNGLVLMRHIKADSEYHYKIGVASTVIVTT